MATILPQEGSHFVSLAQAKEMTARYRAQKEKILAPEYQGKDILLICETYSRDAFDALLAEADAAGIRIYFGMSPELQVRVIAVAVNKEGQDLLPDETDAAASSGDKIVEEGQTCPPVCPVPPL